MILPNGQASPKDCATCYLTRGRTPIPVQRHSKVPTCVDWLHLGVTHDDVHEYSSDEINIGAFDRGPSVKEVVSLPGPSLHTVDGLSTRRLIPVQRLRQRVLLSPSRTEASLAHQPGAHAGLSSHRPSHAQPTQTPHGRRQS
jgi:hypothetical protein